MISTRIARTTAVVVCSLAALLLPAVAAQAAQDQPVDRIEASAQPATGDTGTGTGTDDFGWQ
ncbi:hypothetical protein ACF07V_26390 [Streptomyces sp. NPDC015661]|uniref:hypothetical protein n=1 Tax=Streptomyces sp. NPDC015661 TaxID=3364961 RepID=UPI00370082CC